MGDALFVKAFTVLVVDVQKFDNLVVVGYSFSLNVLLDGLTRQTRFGGLKWD